MENNLKREKEKKNIESIYLFQMEKTNRVDYLIPEKFYNKGSEQIKTNKANKELHYLHQIRKYRVNNKFQKKKSLKKILKQKKKTEILKNLY